MGNKTSSTCKMMNKFENGTIDIDTYNDTSCSICLNPLIKNGDCKSNCQTCITTEIWTCKHQFHKSCINEWEEHSISCPLCRCEERIDGNSYLTDSWDDDSEYENEEEYEVNNYDYISILRIRNYNSDSNLNSNTNSNNIEDNPNIYRTVIDNKTYGFPLAFYIGPITNIQILVPKYLEQVLPKVL